MSLESYLDQAIKIVCPIDGVSFPNLSDKTTWKIHFTSDANEQQKIAAQTVMDNFIWDTNTQEIDRKNIRNDLYKNDLLMKKGYADYKLLKPDATFSDYLDYLESIA